VKRARILGLARRAILVFALLALGYLYWRFGVIGLPDSSCSPLLRFSAGSSLVVDKHPPEYELGDAVFFVNPNGALFLGLIEERRRTGYWIVADNPQCSGRASAEFGVIETAALRGRVLFAHASR